MMIVQFLGKLALNETTLKTYFVNSSNDCLTNTGCRLQIMPPIHQDLWFHNRYKSICLADGRISGQHCCIIFNGQLAGRIGSYLVGTAPFGKTTSLSIKFSAAFRQSVQSLSGGLFSSARQYNCSLSK